MINDWMNWWGNSWLLSHLFDLYIIFPNPIPNRHQSLDPPFLYGYAVFYFWFIISDFPLTLRMPRLILADPRVTLTHYSYPYLIPLVRIFKSSLVLRLSFLPALWFACFWLLFSLGRGSYICYIRMVLLSSLLLGQTGHHGGHHHLSLDTPFL